MTLTSQSSANKRGHIAEALQSLAVPIADLHEDPSNARKGHAIDRIAASLAQYGQRKPIVVNRLQGNKVEAGNGTLAAAKSLGWAEIAAVFVEDDAATAAAFGIADNRVGEFSEWDADILADLMPTLDGLTTGFTEKELKALLPVQHTEGDTEPKIDKAEELRQKWGVESGQMWRLGEHRIICGDCTDASVVARVMDGEKADCLLTDPPYGMDLDTDWSDLVGSMGSIGAKNNSRGNKYSPVLGDDKPFDPAHLFESFGYCSEIFLWGADYYAERIPDRGKGAWLVWDKRKPSQSEAIGSEFELCWTKQKHKRRILRHDWFGFLSSSNPTEARNRVHPTQKPTSLIGEILDKWTLQAGIVADPYLGSGTTLIACENLGRKCRAVEISPGYVAVAIERWSMHTGGTPELIDA